MLNFPSPLPLAAFEEYMLRDDRPKYPMGIIGRLRFTGRLDPQAASVALLQVISRHPLLRAKIQRTPGGRLAWIPVDDHLPSIQWLDGPVHDRLPSMRPIDLFSEPGLRIWVATDAHQSWLSLQVHHAVCDGKGVLQVADDFLRSYALAVDRKDVRVELSPSDAEALRRRGTFGLNALKYLRMLPGQAIGLLGVRKFLMRQPVPLLDAADADSGELPISFPDVRVGRLKAEELSRLSAAAADSKVTTNDWLVRDFFVAVDDFRARHQVSAAGGWIRFSVPISLRQAADCHLPAANVVSMIFLDRNPAQIADPNGLLQSIHEEMDLIRRHQLGLIFVLSLWVLRALPGGLASRVSHGRCEATCVLSNLGRAMADSPLPRRDGKVLVANLVLDEINFFAPVRNGTAVTVALVFYAGELHICMQYDSRRITQAQADDLMATYLRKIRTSLDTVSRSIQGKAA
ncbi:MAG: WS/DGAT domain-containing protein [Thermoguttaceae bacterium]